MFNPNLWKNKSYTMNFKPKKYQVQVVWLVFFWGYTFQFESFDPQFSHFYTNIIIHEEKDNTKNNCGYFFIIILDFVRKPDIVIRLYSTGIRHNYRPY